MAINYYYLMQRALKMQFKGSTHLLLFPLFMYVCPSEMTNSLDVYH